tara:strand:+ start:1500 stop:2579 length:1080 start_codon:yes stop_codon:yes gene_type:complete
MKFYFRAQDISIQLPGLDTSSKLVVAWKRGPRRTETGPIEVKEQLSNVDGSLTRSANTLQDLALICTMFKNSKTGGFESKSAAFTIREDGDTGEERKLGTVNIDLSAYASPEVSSDPVELSFMDGKVLLKMTLSSHWLKHMAGGDDDDAASVSTLGSYASDRPDDEPTPSLSSLQMTPQAPGAGVGAAAAPAAAAGSSSAGGSGGKAYTPIGADERARINAARDEQIEKLWADQSEKASEKAAAEELTEELRQCRDKVAHNKDETKYLRDKLERLATENRVLRREQRTGKRDDVILQLEVELEAKEGERAEMEEQLSAAFGGVIKELQARVTSLVTERDALLVRQEAAAGKKGGFLTSK